MKNQSQHSKLSTFESSFPISHKAINLRIVLTIVGAFGIAKVVSILEDFFSEKIWSLRLRNMSITQKDNFVYTQLLYTIFLICV